MQEALLLVELEEGTELTIKGGPGGGARSGSAGTGWAGYSWPGAELPEPE